MNAENGSRRPEGPLRRGWTTGACAAAAASAAYRALLTGRFPDPVTIALPKGERPSFALSRQELADDHATAGVIKDAGDDPDVTHGAEIVATVARGMAGTGVQFRAGEGVGTVTRAGLPLAVGEPAINPGPRGIIATALAAVAAETSGGSAPPDVVVTVAIPGGEALAAKTTNGRLGIVGGLSVLGTTGVVIPYSCSSWIHSIHRGVDVARAAGCRHIAAATGRTSEEAVQRLTGLSEMALIDMGDFAGGLLKYLARHPINRLTLAGGFGKLAKLAQGHLDLHSSRSRLDTAVLARWAGESGADADTATKIAAAASGGEALVAAGQFAPTLIESVAKRAREVARATAGGRVAIDVIVVERDGRITAHVGA